MALRRRLYSLWPFLGGGLAAFVALPLGARESPAGHVETGVAGALFLGIVASTLLPWERLPRFLAAPPLVAAFAIVALLRDAESGASSGYGPLVLLPVLWLALHGSRRALVASFAAVAAVFVAPILVEPTGYPSAEWRRALVWLVVTPIVGLTTQRLVAQTRQSADADPLTGLANRRAWDTRLRTSMSFSQRSGLPLTVALFDLDGFKAYNDTRGHLAGDRLLVRVASSWLGQLRASDLLARLGGDEFALLLPDTSFEEATAVVARALASIPDIHCSTGLAEWDRKESADDLLLRADTGLYADKADHVALR